MSLSPRPDIKNLEACPHGGPDWAELKAMGFTPEQILDFSVSSNPFPLPSKVRRSFNAVSVERYPDSESTEFRECLSGKLGIAPGNILAGNGSMEIIRLIALAYLGRGESSLIFEPTFGEWEVACRIAGAVVFKQWARDSFVPKIDEIVEFIKRHHPRAVFICNPNNPTGQYLSREEIEMILEASADSLIVLDEAYIAFVDESWSSVDLISRGNLAIVRSMTKDYALAGLRLGYAIACEEIIDSLRRLRPPWNVNAMAQKAGLVMLEDTDYLERCKRKIRRAKQFLVDELQHLGFTLVPSRANFFLMRTGNAKAFRIALLKRGMMVRDCTSFGIPEYVRIAPRTMPECQKFIDTIKALKSEGGLDVSV